jgi:hypothetical protein
MMTVGYSGTPLQKKLGIKPGMSIALLHAPPDVKTILGELPDGVTTSRRLTGHRDLVLIFIARQVDLAQAGEQDRHGYDRGRHSGHRAAQQRACRCQGLRDRPGLVGPEAGDPQRTSLTAGVYPRAVRETRPRKISQGPSVR